MSHTLILKIKLTLKIDIIGIVDGIIEHTFGIRIIVNSSIS